MEEDESEDVVLMDSPLYHHLQEMGFKEFETAQRCESASTEESPMHIPKVEESLQKHQFFLRPVIDNLYQQFIKSLGDWNKQLADDIIKVIIGSQFLLENDRALLEDLLVGPSVPNEIYATKLYSKFFNMSNTISIAISILSVSYLIAFITYLESSVWNWIYFILSSLYLSLVAGLYISQQIWRVRSNQLSQRTGELLSRVKRLQEYFKKGIRMIQEAELIARGFTLISVQATAQRLERSVSLPVRAPEKQCPELRESIFHFSRKCFFCFKDATCQLLKLFPLHKDIDMSSHYLACVKLEDLGPLFTNLDNDFNKEYLEELTDFFSVSSLKSVTQMLELQQSEYFRRFGLSFLYCCSSYSNIFSVKQALQTHTQMESMISGVSEPLTSAINGLEKLLLYYKHLGTSKSYFEEKSSQSSTSSHNRPFQTAVHSLLLHLQASILRVQDIESQVELLPENIELDKEQSVSFDKILQEVQAELDSSLVCLDESFSRLKSSEPKPVAKAYKPVMVELEPSAPIPLFEMGDPVIEDQVFEAFTTHIEDGSKSERDSEFWFSDEKETRKRVKDSSANLLKELKSVLIDKAEEHRIREAKAKEKNEGILPKPVIVDPPTVPDSNNTSMSQSDISTSLDFTDNSEETITENLTEDLERSKTVCTADSESTGSIEIISSDSPLDEKFLDFLETEHDSASTGSIEACGDSPLIEQNSDLQSFIGSSGFNFVASVAAQVAQRSLLLGLKQQTFTAEPEETFGDSSEDSNNS